MKQTCLLYAIITMSVFSSWSSAPDLSDSALFTERASDYQRLRSDDTMFASKLSRVRNEARGLRSKLHGGKFFFLNKLNSAARER